MITGTRLSLGRVIPLVIAMVMVLDVAAHALPAEWVAFRAWEVVTRYPIGAGHFTPNAHYENEDSFGDLAALANRPDWRAYRRETFTVDRAGFRKNPGATDSTVYKAIIIGDSFGVGSGVSDNETLAVELERETGRPTFNAASLPIDLRHLLPLVDQLRISRGVVLYEYLEREDLPSSSLVYTQPLIANERVFRAASVAAKVWKGFWDICPLTILSQGFYKRLEREGALPDDYGGNVVAASLRGGSRMLFLPSEIANFRKAHAFDLSGMLTMRDALAARGLEFRMVLVPEKHTVYAPLLANPPAEPSALYLNVLEEKLRAAGISVVNLLPVFRQAAAEQLSTGRRLYLDDDTHWNADGVRLAAETVSDSERKELTLVLKKQ